MSDLDIEQLQRAAQQQGAMQAHAADRRLEVASRILAGLLPTREMEPHTIIPVTRFTAKVAVIAADQLVKALSEDPATWLKPEEEATSHPWDGRSGECPNCEEDVAAISHCTTTACPTMIARGVADLGKEGGDSGES